VARQVIAALREDIESGIVVCCAQHMNPSHGALTAQILFV
jgi:hypothetical protein